MSVSLEYVFGRLMDLEDLASQGDLTDLEKQELDEAFAAFRELVPATVDEVVGNLLVRRDVAKRLDDEADRLRARATSIRVHSAKIRHDLKALLLSKGLPELDGTLYGVRVSEDPAVGLDLRYADGTDAENADAPSLDEDAGFTELMSDPDKEYGQLKASVLFAKAIREVAQGMIEHAREIEDMIEDRKVSILDFMRDNGMKRIKGVGHSFSVGTSQAVEIGCDLSELPEAFLKVSIEPRKAELRNALKRGDVIDGVNLVTTQHLTYR